MKIPIAIVLIVTFAGCVMHPTDPEESPPAHKDKDVPAPAMFDTLCYDLVWSSDEQYCFTSGRSGLVRVEIATGATAVIDPRVVYYTPIFLSGSGNYLYCLAWDPRSYAYHTYTYAVLRYRLSDFAQDTIVSGGDLRFVASPVSDELGWYNSTSDSIVLINPTLGTRWGISSTADLIAYSPDGTDLLLQATYASNQFSILHRDSSVTPMGITGHSGFFGQQEIIWGFDGVKILYTVTPDYGEASYRVYDVTTATEHGLGTGEGVTPGFSRDGSHIAYWTMNVTEWLYLIFWKVPSEADFILNSYTFSSQTEQSSTVAHSDSPSRVTLGPVSYSPSGTRLAFIYNGSMKTMNVQ